MFKANGEAGKHLATVPPYGYMKSPDNPQKWIIDEEAAKIVKKIYNLCLESYGTSQAAKILHREKILTPRSIE